MRATVGSTNPSGAAATAWQVVLELVQAASRTVREQVHAVLERIVQRPPRLGGPVGAVPRGAATPGRAAATAGPTASPDLPRSHGPSRAVLVAQDPWSLFAYWEIPPVRRVEMLRSLGPDGEAVVEVLRIYEIDATPQVFRDVALAAGSERVHVRVEHPGRTYRVEVGLRTPSGSFVVLAASDPVATPPAAPSSDTSVRWVALAPRQPPREVAKRWSGQRVASPRTATAVGPAPAPRATGSSEALPPRARASDALPIG
jgi:hypothetical protein